MNKNKIKLEIKNVFKNPQIHNQKVYVKADIIKKLWLKCFDETESEFIINGEDTKQFIKNTNFETLRYIGKEISNVITNNAYEQLQLVKILWDSYGKEGKLVATYVLNQINQENPNETMPFIKELIKRSTSLEECDNLTIKSIEPVILKNFDDYIYMIFDWANDENKWVRRSAVTIAGRIPTRLENTIMESLKIINSCLVDKSIEVKKSVSLSLKLIMRVDNKVVINFLKQLVENKDSKRMWIINDLISNSSKNKLSQLKELHPILLNYYNNNIDESSRYIILSALKTLELCN